ncbi:MAG: hypothetical protein C4530_00925 [Desulfobacteraceae bacterium]|nr:MAG: hypothetical protein C4530_00925 [Desulfobacteraceae bacterium]
MINKTITTPKHGARLQPFSIEEEGTKAPLPGWEGLGEAERWTRLPQVYRKLCSFGFLTCALWITA